ncbi:FtsX-like permease family protein [Nonomuraea sp. NPDC050643]|uniref:FtsX-like permease family protein n=1 Tax=Nonomuraea sp. NPDC050643 TaxID=3155660 RepID=UPI0033E0391E
MSALGAALRISRRDSLRFKGRSALIMVMIGLPVLVITAVLTLSASTDLTVREQLPGRLGSVADAAVMPHAKGLRVQQDPAGRFGNQRDTKGTEQPAPWTAAEVVRLTGGRLIPFYDYSVEALLPDGFDAVDLMEIDLRDPLGRGVRTLVEGRFPATPQEIAVTPALLDQGVRLGGELKTTLRAVPKRVVGVVEHPDRPGISEVVGLYGSVLATKADPQGSGWLLDSAAPVTWDDVRRLNQAGLRVASRAVIESPRAGTYGYGAPTTGQWRWTAIGVLLVVTETALLAGPAFAVGLRRRRRELAMISAQGGSPRHLRAIVLADGLVLGGIAALLGAALGIGAGLAVESALARALDWTSSLDVPWPEVLGVAGLGLLSALVAAVVPAIQAAGQSPARVLAGRPDEVRDRAGRPVLGIVLVLLGVGATLTVAVRSELAVVAASTVTLFGLIVLTPWLVSRTARPAARLPLPARLSVRDGARHRVRTASAVAAVMAATMVAITVGIAYNSVFADRARTFRSAAPDGTLDVHVADADDRTWSKVRAKAQEQLPGVSLITAQEAVDGQGKSLVTTATRAVNCPPAPCTPFYYYDLPIGDDRLLALFQGRRDPQAAAALAAGKAVVFDPRLIEDGMVRVGLQRNDGGEARPGGPIRIPAVAARGVHDRQGGAVLPASALTAAGLKLAERRLYAMTIPDDVLRLQRALQYASRGTFVQLHEDGIEQRRTLLLTGVLAGALILVLGGTFAATGLAVADMRRDLDTLSAVGGRPLTRRLVVAAQAAYIAGLGTVTGLAGGVVAGSALAQPMKEASLDATVTVPWSFLAAIVLGLPLLAALLAGLFTRTRLVLARRVA